MLKNMNRKNDQYGISTKHLLDALPIIGDYFVQLINESIKNGIFPNIWKESIKIPVAKVKRARTPVQYRPLNNLQTPEKILEETVKEQLVNYLEKYNILNKFQSGYRKGFSCESALNFIVTSWKNDLDSNNGVVAVFLDFKRAFETVNRVRLLKKLEMIGVTGRELKWFESYLHNRTQKTKVGDKCSESKINEFGVPQGSSVLRAILFIIYINDIDNVLQHCKIHLFADDTFIYINEKNLSATIEKLNSDLNKLFKWLCENELKLNLDKTKSMIFGFKNKTSEIKIQINNCEIELVKTYKYLGIVIDNELKFKDNVNYICKKMSMKVGVLARLRKKLSFNSAVNIYKTVTAPNLDFVATILLSCNDGDINRLQKMQNKAMRVILRVSKYTPIQEMLDALYFLSVKQRIVYNVIVMVFKIKNHMVPDYFDEMFRFGRDVHRYSMRNKNDFRLPAVNKEGTKKGIFYNGIQMYNELPMDLKLLSDINTFKKQIILYVKSKF